MSTNKNNKDNTKEILKKDISVTKTEPEVIENSESLKKVDEDVAASGQISQPITSVQHIDN